VPGEGSVRTLRETLAVGQGELAAYVLAGVVYVAIGVILPDFLFSWFVAAGYLVLCLLTVPALLRRLAR
jgi:hypothetical protein